MVMVTARALVLCVRYVYDLSLMEKMLTNRRYLPRCRFTTYIAKIYPHDSVSTYLLRYAVVNSLKTADTLHIGFADLRICGLL